jgi:hypothetical protein
VIRDITAHFHDGAYTDAFEFSLWRVPTASIAISGGSGWRQGEANDPTGRAALAWDQRQVRSAVRDVAGMILRAHQDLERARLGLAVATTGDWIPKARGPRASARASARRRILALL